VFVKGIAVRLSLSEKPGECGWGERMMVWGEFWERRGGIMAD
jgi:hypothetical protein